MLYLGLTLTIQILLVGLFILIDKYKDKTIVYLQSFILLINLVGYYSIYKASENLNINISAVRFIYIIICFGITFTIFIWGIYGYLYGVKYKLFDIKSIFLNKRIIINSLLIGFSHVSIIGILHWFYML